MIVAFLFLIGQIHFESVAKWDMADHEIYGSETPFAVSNNGIVAILDVDQRRVVLIDPTDNSHKTFGAKGEGPGEFQRPFSISWLDQSKVFAVLDKDNNRLSKWDANGGLVEEVSLSTSGFLWGASFLDAENLLWIRNPRGMKGTKPTLFHYDLEQQQNNQVWQYQPRLPDNTYSVNGSVFEITLAWDPSLLFGVGSDFIAVMFGGANQLHILDRSGKMLNTVEDLDFPRPPISDAQKEFVFNGGPMTRMPPPVRKMVMDNQIIPDKWQNVIEIRVDSEDRIWVFGPSSSLTAPAPYRIVNRKGDLIRDGKINAIPSYIFKNVLYYITSDEENRYLEKVSWSQ